MYITLSDLLREHPEFEIFRRLRNGEWTILGKHSGELKLCPLELTESWRLSGIAASFPAGSLEWHKACDHANKYRMNYYGDENLAWSQLKEPLSRAESDSLKAYLENAVFLPTNPMAEVPAQEPADEQETKAQERPSTRDKAIVRQQAEEILTRDKDISVTDLAHSLVKIEPGSHYYFETIIKWIRDLHPNYTGKPGRKKKIGTLQKK